MITVEEMRADAQKLIQHGDDLRDAGYERRVAPLRVSPQEFLAAITAHDEQVRAAAWDEACKALAWCFDNGPERDALPYLIEHNPYRVPAEQKESNQK